MELSLDKIHIDGGTQPRSRIDTEYVSELSEKLSALPPVEVFFDGTDYWLADGFHRFHAHNSAKTKTIKALVHRGTRRDAILFSVGANDTHGLRRSRDDKRVSVNTLLSDPEWAAKSDRWIADQCNVSHQFVAKMRESSGGNVTTSNATGDTENAVLPQNGRQGQDGKTYPVSPPKSPPESTPTPSAISAPPAPAAEPAEPEEEEWDAAPFEEDIPIPLTKTNFTYHAEVPPRVRDVFEESVIFDEFLNHLTQCRTILNKLAANGPTYRGMACGVAVRWGEAKDILDSLRVKMSQNRPAMLCPYCFGRPGKCETCGGRGWILARGGEVHKRELVKGMIK